MKKLIALVMTLAVVLSLGAVASAETITVNWADFEAGAAELDPQGSLQKVVNMSDTQVCMMWIPAVFSQIETDEYLFTYGAESGEDAAVILASATATDAASVEELAAAWEEAGYSDVQILDINGFTAVTLLDEANDTAMLAYLTTANNLFLIAFYPNSSGPFTDYLMYMMASVQFVNI